MSQYDNISVVKKANVYFDGKCISHTVVLADGTKKTEPLADNHFRMLRRFAEELLSSKELLKLAD